MPAPLAPWRRSFTSEKTMLDLSWSAAHAVIALILVGFLAGLYSGFFG